MSCIPVQKEKFERLPEAVRPSHYTLKLAPDLKNFTFTGECEICVDFRMETNVIKLHTQDLRIVSAVLKMVDLTELPIEKHSYDRKWNMTTLTLPRAVPALTAATISLKYAGILNDKMRGFYRSSYKAADGTEKFLASTQFESTYARYAFPCFDEPIYKATFDVSLDVAVNLTALSNMNAIDTITSKDQTRKTIKFARTPRMSTYLVAFAVGEFEYIEKRTNNGCATRIYTVPGKKQQGEFSLQLAARAIDWFNGWFGIPYPLPKCDLIAIPDFSSGAMENWGLITFREVELLIDPAKSSTKQKSRVSLTVAHELAHMWFGNLVTMKWWTDLWLKEGFASFMEYKFVGANYDEFKIWLHYLNDELAEAFRLDSLRSSHPIEVEIDNPNELDEIYDSITYAKSNSVNRMLCYYLGEPTFQKGLRIYLQKFQYRNAETLDLWQALTQASGQDIVAMMSGWTKQMGYPVITVEERVDGTKRILKLKQSRFLADGSVDEKNQQWQVPITVCVAKDPKIVKQRFLLTKPEDECVVKDVKQGDWLKLNVGTTAFYRVHYSAPMLNSMLPAISNKTMDVLDRFGITNDLFALVEAGKVRAPEFLSLVKASVNEEEYVVWSAIDGGLSALSNVLNYADEDGSAKKLFNEHVAKLLAPVSERIGWELKKGEDSQRMLLRSLIHGRLAKSNHQPTIDKVQGLFKEHIANRTELHPDLRAMIYAAAARNGGKEVFDQLTKLYETVGFGEVERQCLVALSQVPDMALLSQLFVYGIKNGKVKSQDMMLLFVGPGSSKAGQVFVWTYFKENMTKLMENFGGAGAGLFQTCLKYSAESSCLEKDAADVEAFFCKAVDNVARQTLDRPIRQVTESIRLNASLLAKNKEHIIEYLKAN